MSTQGENPHIVLVPFMAQGHMIPMLDIARLLSDRGIHVSFIMTPLNATRIKPMLHSNSPKNKLINIVELTFPCKEFGLPEGCENVDLITSPEHFLLFYHAANSLSQQLHRHIKDAWPKVNYIVSDFCNYFTAEVGKSLNIPCIVFHGPSCLAIHSVQSMLEHNSYDGKGEFDVIVVPDFPKKIEVTKAQAPGWFSFPGAEPLHNKAMEAQASASGFVMNTYYELESESIDRYERLMDKKVWPMGPLCLYDNDVDSKVNRGKKSSIDTAQVVRWLDAKKPKSVVYVNFGSLVLIKTSQLIEIGKGLESSNMPFIWVIKEAERTFEFDKWMSEQGFEERSKGRGFVITGWAPQVVILSHGSIGGFMTHCGWNSMLEAISAGVPMVTWPHFADQFLNEKLVVEIIGTGIAIGVEKPSHYYYSEDEVPMKWEGVEKALLRLMEKGKEGDGRRARAMKYGQNAKKATEEGGSSWNNLNLFVEHITGVKSGYLT